MPEEQVTLTNGGDFVMTDEEVQFEQDGEQYRRSLDEIDNMNVGSHVDVMMGIVASIVLGVASAVVFFTQPYNAAFLNGMFTNLLAFTSFVMMFYALYKTRYSTITVNAGGTEYQFTTTDRSAAQNIRNQIGFSRVASES